MLRIAALLCAVLWLSSTAYAQDSRNKMMVEQQLRMQQLQQNGQLTDAQKQAIQLRMLQNLRGQKQGPKTGVYPGTPMQGNGMMPMQGNMNGMNGGAGTGVAPQTQADKSRAELKKKADAKKARGEKKEKKEKPEGDKKKAAN